MVKTLTDYLRDKNILFEKMQKIEPKELGSRKKITIFNCINLKGEYVSLFYIKQSSRFLIKNAEQIHQLQIQLQQYTNHNFKRNIFIIDAPLCSKAKKYLSDMKWSVYNDAM